MVVDHSLDNFIITIQQELKKFEEEYRENHKKDPENYPLEMTEENSGLWVEFFMMQLNS